ncbi:MAG: hypothetical protein M1830_000236 [Pleopsidium flavum]|nr:MAG: hypothetical protein M1830_000236 [Pleopsidium flavum]
MTTITASPTNITTAQLNDVTSTAAPLGQKHQKNALQWAWGRSSEDATDGSGEVEHEGCEVDRDNDVECNFRAEIDKREQASANACEGNGVDG